MPVLWSMATYHQEAMIEWTRENSCLVFPNRTYCRVLMPTVNADNARSGSWIELLTQDKLRNMNANPTPYSASKVQLLTKPSFADLRGAKLFRCVRLVGAVGIEPTALISIAWRAGGNSRRDVSSSG